MTLNTARKVGDSGHVSDHNVVAAFVNTHDDVDAAPTAHHHTLGTGADQAAAGNHTHTVTKTIRIPHTYAFYGSSLTGTGATPPFTVPGSQAAELAVVDYACDSGSATVVVQQFVSGEWATITTLPVTSTASRFSPETTLSGSTIYSDSPLLRLNFTAVNSPSNLFVTLHIDCTV